MHRTQINTPLGVLEIKGNMDGICKVVFSDASEITDSEVPKELEDAVFQLQEYFAGERNEFQLALTPEGTEFQKKVWNHLQYIDFGKTKSYQQIANELGDPKVIRAAAAANGKNPIAIIIPCHRVIGSDGSLTGYAGGLGRKKWLLAHESPVRQGELF